MYKKELMNLINQKRVPKAMLLYGACDYQINFFGDMITNFWSQNPDEIFTFYFDAYDFNSAKAHLSQSSLFCEKNVAIIKTDKTIPKKELDILVLICQKNENSYLLLLSFEDEQKAKNLTKSFGKKSGADFVRFFKLNVGEALQMLSLEAQKISLEIEPYAMQHLYFLHNEDISLCINELPKLSILQKRISKKDIDELVFGLGDVNIEDFITKIINKKDIKADFKTLSENGHYDEIFIINALQSYICTLFLFHSYIKINGSFDAREILGYPLPPQLAQKRANESMRISLNSFSQILNTLALAEHTLKQGSFSDKNTYLLSTILKVQRLVF